MNHDYSKYLQFLAAEYNVLYLGKNSVGVYKDVSTSFMSSVKRDLNEQELEHISLTLLKHEINLVIIDSKDNDDIVVKFYEEIRSCSSEISIMLMFNPKEYRKLFEVVPLVDITISYPIDEEIFYKRLFTILSAPYALKSIGRRDIVLKQENVKEDALDSFFDTYEGSSLFISDDLSEMVRALNAGELSVELFQDISKKIDEVADIFSKTKQTISVSLIFKELSEFLQNLDLTKIKPENLIAFDYLSQILNDVSMYLLDMFVDRIFKDVYIFEHSLESNIEFLKHTLFGGNEEDGELDFF
ncbi:MAG: hypothetical protein U9N42_05795 [Campylobacterota bacterium]|nr:hypothetical protein [Campylobacterota bacterium]